MTVEPGKLQSIGSQKNQIGLSDRACLHDEGSGLKEEAFQSQQASLPPPLPPVYLRNKVVIFLNSLQVCLYKQRYFIAYIISTVQTSII